MSLKTKTINDVKVRPIKLPQVGGNKIKGHDVIKELYANVMLVARKKMGKTNVVNTLLQRCAGKKTIIIVFCSTFYKDASWIAIKKHFDEKGIKMLGYTS